MDAVLKHFETQLAAMDESQRKAAAEAFRSMIRSGQAAMGAFRLPTRVLIQLVGAVGQGMVTGKGADHFVARLRERAKKIGPYVNAFVHAL